MSGRVAVVAGATGMVGRRLVRTLHEQGFSVVGLARRAPPDALPCEMIAVDLCDRERCIAALSHLSAATHVFYAGRLPHTTAAPEPVEANVAMLRNLLDAIEPVARDLAHVHLVHGTKVYGSTLGQYKTPARESDPRSLADTFYYGQEDLVEARQRGRRWTWSTSRPQAVSDTDPAVVRSLPRLLAVYAAISKELGLPLCFPGRPLAYTSLYQVTDAALLARAVAWMATEPRCANQRFNVTNGDYFRWINLWPAIADCFGMRCGEPRPVRLGEVMADKGAVWDRIVLRHGLVRTPFAQAAVWPYGDFVFGNEYDVMSDFTKLRTFGFHECIDSESMFRRMFGELRDARLVP